MLPFPIYYRLEEDPQINCSDQFDPSRNETWPTCPQLRNQAYTFLAFSLIILCLSIVSQFVRRNQATEPTVASMIGAMLAAETVIAVCLLADSAAFLGLDLCRDFPLVRLGPVASVALGANQWLAQVCLFYRNWLVALISVTRYRLFSRLGGTVARGRQIERRSLRQFRLASCALLAESAAFSGFLSLKTVGYLCPDRVWGPIRVDRLLLAVDNGSLFVTVNTTVVFPIQVVLPLIIGLAASTAVLVTLWRHMVGNANNRHRYRRPFVAFLSMNITLLLLYLPTMLIRILVLLDYDLNHLFWVSNLLCCTNSLANMLVYFYLCKACGSPGGQQPGSNGKQLQGRRDRRATNNEFQMAARQQRLDGCQMLTGGQQLSTLLRVPSESHCVSAL